MAITENLKSIKKRIGSSAQLSGRNPASILLVAVTKTRPLEDIHTLMKLGVRELAENRVQDVRDRIPQIATGPTWHFIGHLQTNKVKFLPGLISVVHSVDRIEIAEALQKAWENSPELPPLRVLLQFNIAEEPQKSGASMNDAKDFLRRVREFSRLQVEGLMTMAPLSENPEDSRPVFRALRLLRDGLQESSGIPLPALSMGMSGDFQVAVEEGATMVRIGSALFNKP